MTREDSVTVLLVVTGRREDIILEGEKDQIAKKGRREGNKGTKHKPGESIFVETTHGRSEGDPCSLNQYEWGDAF